MTDHQINNYRRQIKKELLLIKYNIKLLGENNKLCEDLKHRRKYYLDLLNKLSKIEKTNNEEKCDCLKNCSCSKTQTCKVSVCEQDKHCYCKKCHRHDHACYGVDESFSDSNKSIDYSNYFPDDSDDTDTSETSED